MSYSLNEIEAASKRAARGAGYSWGCAEEAAKATRWLCANGQDGVTILAGLLDRRLAVSADHAPTGQEGEWRADGELCPLVAGAYLSDCAHQLAKDAIHMRRVAAPLVILPFAANAARFHKCCVTVDIDGQLAITDGVALSCPDGIPAQAEELTVRTGGELAARCRSKSRATPDPDSWARLNEYAYRTYAPATDESRRLGAGAGLSDND